jgi:hypothetical protein
MFLRRAAPEKVLANAGGIDVLHTSSDAMRASALIFSSGRPRPRVFPALFAPLLKHRGWTGWIVGGGVLQLALVASGHAGLGCPIREASGIPCPGCGLTTACEELLHGDLGAALATHAFAPVFLLGLATLAVVSLLPAKLHARAVAAIARLEERTGFTVILLVALFAYWALRVA